jgi:receptor protein-tyrosine kinase
MKLIRTRWILVCFATLVGVLAAVAITLVTTPMYAATTRLFVSTTSGVSATDLYQGNRLSQDRVASYLDLVTGETLAQRTIDKMGLDMSAEALQKNVKATAKPDTVLINVQVLDASAVRARDIANALSDEFVTMVRELETPDAATKPDARVVVEKRASVPQHPVVPKTTRDIAIGLGLGLMLGIGLAYLRESLDNTVKDRETLEEITGIALVGSVPFDKERPAASAVPFDGNYSAIAEAFRKLRTNLQFVAVDNPPRVIVVTSSMPDEGKTTAAINIALALAEADHNVALVDGDMRRPMLAKILGLVEPVGFSTVLSGRVELDAALQRTQYPGLTVLTSGAVPPNPSELLGSMAAEKVLNEMRMRFDYVIVDSSPLLAVTDAAVLAANSDGALIMARYGQTKRDQLTHAIGSLDYVGALLLGAVFSFTPPREGTAYSYDYYYGRDGKEGARQLASKPEPPQLDSGQVRALQARPSPQPPHADVHNSGPRHAARKPQRPSPDSPAAALRPDLFPPIPQPARGRSR